jgi:hypothetical protein
MLLDTPGQFLTVAAMALQATAEHALATQLADMLHQVAHVFWDHLARLQLLQELPLQPQ